MTAVRRLAAALLAVAGLVLATAAPASAHAGGAEPGDWLAVVDAVSPEMPGVSLQLVDRGEEVELENRSAVPVIVLGYDGEPYLRVTTAGVEQNDRSAAAYLNRTRDSRSPVPDSALDPAAPPQWRSVSAEPRWRWHDHRTHWMEDRLPPSVVDRPADGPFTVEVSAFRLELRHGEQPVAVSGRLLWIEPPSPLPWVALGVVLLGAGLAAGRLRRWRAPAAVLLAVLLAVDVAHAVADGQLAGALPSAVGWALGGVTLVGLVRGARWAPYPLAITGVLLAVVDGLGDLGVLAHSQVPGGPAWLARLAATAALGLGLAVAATGWQVWRREHPLPTAGGAATSPDPEPVARPARR